MTEKRTVQAGDLDRSSSSWTRTNNPSDSNDRSTGGAETPLTSPYVYRDVLLSTQFTDNNRTADLGLKAGRAALVIADVLWTSVIATLISVAYAVTGAGTYLGLHYDAARPNLATAWLIGYLTAGCIALCVWLVRVSKRWAR